MIFLTEVQGMSRLFDLDWQLIADSCLSIIAVFVLFLLMSYLLFNPARNMLNSRKDKIRNDLETAKQDKEEAGRLKEEYETKLKEIDREAESILSEARKKALNNENQIIAQAKEKLISQFGGYLRTLVFFSENRYSDPLTLKSAKLSIEFLRKDLAI